MYYIDDLIMGKLCGIKRLFENQHIKEMLWCSEGGSLPNCQSQHLGYIKEGPWVRTLSGIVFGIYSVPEVGPLTFLYPFYIRYKGIL
jgi:hypothetical protein